MYSTNYLQGRYHLGTTVDFKSENDLWLKERLSQIKNNQVNNEEPLSKWKFCTRNASSAEYVWLCVKAIVSYVQVFYDLQGGRVVVTHAFETGKSLYARATGGYEVYKNHKHLREILLTLSVANERIYSTGNSKEADLARFQARRHGLTCEQIENSESFEKSYKEALENMDPELAANLLPLLNKREVANIPASLALAIVYKALEYEGSEIVLSNCKLDFCMLDFEKVS